MLAVVMLSMVPYDVMAAFAWMAIATNSFIPLLGRESESLLTTPSIILMFTSFG